MKSLVSFSGGLDSACLLAHLKSKGLDVECVSFTYGSKHNQYENEAAKAICAWYDLPFTLIDMSAVLLGFKSDLLKNGGNVPEGHYEKQTMKSTVVPARNMIFISILTGLAESIGCDIVELAVHSGDHHIYPDCRPGFINAIQPAIREATDNKVQLLTPFLYHSKAEILWKGLLAKAPLHLTRTCYKDQPIACGKCGSCLERLEAFQENGESDPIAYNINI